MKAIHSLFQLLPTPAHITQAFAPNFNFRLFIDSIARLIKFLIVHIDEPCHNQRFCFFTALSQALFTDQDINPFFQSNQILSHRPTAKYNPSFRLH